jgi:hypothetical protein
MLSAARPHGLRRADTNSSAWHRLPGGSHLPLKAAEDTKDTKAIRLEHAGSNRQMLRALHVPGAVPVADYLSAAVVQ